MALVLIEGFDHLSSSTITNKGWVGTPTAFQTGRFDGQSCRITGNNTLAKTLPTTYSTLFFGFAVKSSAVTGASNWLIVKTAASATIMAVAFDASGHILFKNSGGTTIGTTTTALTNSNWFYVEVKLVVNGASGSITVNINGAADIAVTTGNFGSTNINILQFGSSGSTPVHDYDDMYALDTTGSAPRNTFLGDVRVETIYPTGAGAHTQWTPDSGSNYARVNEAQADGDTSYVSDSTPNDLDSYVYGDIDGSSTVYAVQTNLYARKDDAAVRQIAPLIRQSSTDYIGSTVTLGAAYSDFTQIYNQDPTAADWTASTVNNNEFGVKEIA